MKFIELHYGNGDAFYVNPKNICVVANVTTSIGTVEAAMYTNGDSAPHFFVEPIEEVMELLEEYEE